MGEKRKRECENRISWGLKFDIEQNLCNESIEKILLHSPPSTVARFKCVSTQWCSRLSKSSFINRYKSTNLSLLGFMYNKSYDRVRFNPVSNNVAEQSAMIDILMANQSPDNSYCIVGSSNGLQLLYSSNFRNKRAGDPQFVVRNFVSGTVTGIGYTRTLSFPGEVSLKFNVFGFYFDPYCEKPNFTIVEITHDGNRFRTCKFNSSVSGGWTSKFHTISSGSFYVLTGSSTFLNGSLHWLAQPSGVVSYDLQTEDLRLFDEIPGDSNGTCLCVEKIREAPGCYSNGDCSCRFLGEVKDKLVYIRVTGDFVLSMWVLEKYYEGKWSHARRIVIDGFPASSPSAFFGKVLSFDRKDPNVIYIRLKRTVYSYNIVKRLASEMFVISKDYGGEDNCFGLIIPYEFPRIPMSIWHIPLMAPVSNPDTTNGAMIKNKANYARGGSRAIPNAFPNVPQNSMPAGSPVIDNTLTFYDTCQYISQLQGKWTGRYGFEDKTLEKLRKSEDGRIILHRHIAISQIASKFYNNLNLIEDLNLPPVWSMVDFKSTKALSHLRGISLIYSQIVRFESALYGFAYDRDAVDEEEEEEEEPVVLD